MVGAVCVCHRATHTQPHLVRGAHSAQAPRLSLPSTPATRHGRTCKVAAAVLSAQRMATMAPRMLWVSWCAPPSRKLKWCPPRATRRRRTRSVPLHPFVDCDPEVKVPFDQMVAVHQSDELSSSHTQHKREGERESAPTGCVNKRGSVTISHMKNFFWQK